MEIDLLGPTDAIERVEPAPGPEPALAPIDARPHPRHVPRAAPPEDARVHLAASPPKAAPLASAAPVATETFPRSEAGDVPSGAPAAAPASGAAPESAPLPLTSVDGRARLLRGAAPTYPAQARADGVEGTVGLELVVDASGSLESARVVRGAGHGLDEAALAAAKQFRFTPATKDGRAVRVRMGWSIDFRFRD